MNKLYNLGTGGDTVKCSLYNNSFSFTASSTTYSTTNELATSGGYTQGGVSITSGQTVSTATTTGVYTSTTNPSWTSASFTAYFAVLYDSTASNALICCFDLGGAQTVTSGTFTINWNGSGIIVLS